MPPPEAVVCSNYVFEDVYIFMCVYGYVHMYMYMAFDGVVMRSISMPTKVHTIMLLPSLVLLLLLVLVLVLAHIVYLSYCMPFVVYSM